MSDWFDKTRPSSHTFPHQSSLYLLQDPLNLQVHRGTGGKSTWFRSHKVHTHGPRPRLRPQDLRTSPRRRGLNVLNKVSDFVLVSQVGLEEKPYVSRFGHGPQCLRQDSKENPMSRDSSMVFFPSFPCPTPVVEGGRPQNPSETVSLSSRRRTHSCECLQRRPETSRTPS